MKKTRLNNVDLMQISDALEAKGFDELASKVRHSMDDFWVTIKVIGSSYSILVDTESQFEELLFKLACYYYRLFDKMPRWVDEKDNAEIELIKDMAKDIPDLDAGYYNDDLDREEEKNGKEN